MRLTHHEVPNDLGVPKRSFVGNLLQVGFPGNQTPRQSLALRMLIREVLLGSAATERKGKERMRAEGEARLQHRLTLEELWGPLPPVPKVTRFGDSAGRAPRTPHVVELRAMGYYVQGSKANPGGKGVQKKSGKPGSSVQASQRTSLIPPATNRDNTCEVFASQGSSVETLSPRFLLGDAGGLATEASAACLIANFQNPRGKASVQHKSYCSDTSGTGNHSYQGSSPEAQFPDASQGSALHAGLSKESSLAWLW